MKFTRLVRSALGVCGAAVVLAACGTPAQLGGPAAAPAGGAAAAVRAGADTQTAPQPAAGGGQRAQNRTRTDIGVKGALVYAGGDVSSYVLTYPKGKLVGTIAIVALGACSDANGNVFFTGAGKITEFAHGGTTPIATYSIPGTVYACSIDPTTGNIAAVVLCQSGCGGELVVIRPDSGLAPTFYRDANLPSMLYCTYDDKGNVFIDGYRASQFGIAELPANGNALTDIAVDQNIQYAEQIQWDGRYLAIETRIRPAIYQVQLSGSTGTVAGIVQLSGVGKRATQSWIQNGKIGVPTASPGLNKRAIEIVFWAYPAGGKPINTISGFIGGGHQALDAVTFSVNPHTGPSPSPSPTPTPTPFKR